jgi:hypothetical protein
LTSPQPDIGASAKTLASAVESAMDALYRSQVALINVYEDQPSTTLPLGEVFKGIRSRLRSSWEEIRAYIQSCHAYGEDVVLLQESLSVESAEDCVEFLTEMNDKAKGLQAEAKRLKEQSERDFATATVSLSAYGNDLEVPSTGSEMGGRPESVGDTSSLLSIALGIFKMLFPCAYPLSNSTTTNPYHYHRA